VDSRQGCLEGVGIVLTDKFSLFAGKTVLVTGHTGFKGSWLCLWLQKQGANVIGYALDPKDENDNFIRAKVGENLVDYRGDIRDYDKLSSVISKHLPEFIFHLAAQTLVRESYQVPKETFDVNIGGTVNVLEASRVTPSVKVLINVTSDKCYENKGKCTPYKEKDRLGGFDTYSASKACAELVSSAYGHSFFQRATNEQTRLGMATVRAGNVIGGGDWSKDRIVPDCIRALQSRQAIKIRNPRHTRPWQFVLEPLAGYLLLATYLYNKSEKYSGAWNFGPDPKTTVPVKDLVEKIINAYGQGSWFAKNDSGQPLESFALALDASKAIQKLKWKSALNLEEAIKMTIDWYKFSESNHDLHDFAMRQIEEYAAKLDVFYGNHSR
jgi:CDP-glucose 4,6-dehydratase